MDVLEEVRHVASQLCNEHIEAARAAGKPVVGVSCSYIPEELLLSCNIVPFRLRAPGCAGLEMAEYYLGNVTCTYTRSIMELALDDAFDFLDGYVFAASCDHMRRLHDNLSHALGPAFVQMLDVPHKVHDGAVVYYERELTRLWERLQKHYGVRSDETALSESVDWVNRNRHLLAQLCSLRRADPPPISGADMLALTVACQSVGPVPSRGWLEKLLESIPEHVTDGAGRGKRLLVAGSHLDDPAYLELIEELGGVVVGEVFCTSAANYYEVPVSPESRPLRALARRYLQHIPCPRMMEAFEERLRLVRQRASELNVAGIVVETMKFCDLWGIEGNLLVQQLRQAGHRVLALEREYALTGWGQLRTRVQAFLESLTI